MTFNIQVLLYLPENSATSAVKLPSASTGHGTSPPSSMMPIDIKKSVRRRSAPCYKYTNMHVSDPQAERDTSAMLGIIDRTIGQAHAHVILSKGWRAVHNACSIVSGHIAIPHHPEGPGGFGIAVGQAVVSLQVGKIREQGLVPSAHQVFAQDLPQHLHWS